LPGFAAGEQEVVLLIEIHLPELPDQAFTEAMTGLVLKHHHVVFRRVMFAHPKRHDVLVVDGQNRHHRCLGIRGQKRLDMQERVERDVVQFCGCAVMPDVPVGKHCKRVGIDSVKRAIGSDAKAAAPVDVIHEYEFALVRVGFFKRRELAGLRTEDVGCGLTSGRGRLGWG
jgi:hypothetical protein